MIFSLPLLLCNLKVHDFRLEILSLVKYKQRQLHLQRIQDFDAFFLERGMILLRPLLDVLHIRTK